MSVESDEISRVLGDVLDISSVIVKDLKAKLGILGDVEKLVADVLSSEALKACIKDLAESVAKIPADLKAQLADKDIMGLIQEGEVLVKKIPGLVSAISG